MKKWVGIGIAALLALFATVSAQESPPAGAGPMNRVYKLVVGDSIEIVVDQNPDLGRTYEVPANGEVSFPPLGKLNLLGRALSDLEKEIAQRFKERKQLTNPKVDVLIKAYAERDVYLTGAVASKVPIPVFKPFSILQVLSTAGISEGTGDLRNLQIFRKRPNGKPFVITLNVEDIWQRHEFEKDIVVLPDDVIYIPSFQTATNTSYVYVLGKVGHPGRYPFVPGNGTMTLTKLIALAGDFNQFAEQSEVRILRKEGNRTRAIDIDFSEIIDNKIVDPVLKPDDLVYVPTSPW